MRLIIVQKDVNERDYTPYLEYAKARRADLICFGELGTSGVCTRHARSNHWTR